MKMFLLGMLVMWVALNVMVWIMDNSASNDFRFADLIRCGFPLCFKVACLIECLAGLKIILRLLPLCIKYKINPFNTTITNTCVKLNTEEARVEWLKRFKLERDRNAWQKIFKQIPLESDDYLEELEKKKDDYERLKKRYS